MSASQCILLASLNPGLARALRHEVEHRKTWQLVGPIDPRSQDLLVSACATVDVALIEAEELLWLWDNQPETVGAALRQVHAIVVLSDRQLLDVVTQANARCGLLLRGPNDNAPVDLLALAIEGYVVIPEALLHRLATNRLRLDIVGDLSPDVLRILAYLGAAFSNRHIAEVSGMAESRVKTLVHILTRRLRMNNRTAVAVFAATNGLANMPEEPTQPEHPVAAPANSR